jgi:hypothetical protein
MRLKTRVSDGGRAQDRTVDPYDVNFVPLTETPAFPANGNYATGVSGKMLHFRSSFQVRWTGGALRTLDVQTVSKLAKVGW